MGRRHASVVARQRRTENLDRIILPANDRLACNGPCDGVSGELYNPPDINELSLPFAFKVLLRFRLVYHSSAHVKSQNVVKHSLQRRSPGMPTTFLSQIGHLPSCGLAG